MNISTRIHTLVKDKKAFVFYKKPNATRIHLITQKDNRLHTTTSYSESGFVMAPFDSDNETILFPESLAEYFEFQLPEKRKIVFEPHFKSDKEKRQNTALLDKTIAFIKNGNAAKIVCSRYVEKEYQKESVGVIYEHLVQSYPEAFVYFWSHPKMGTWMGATPEKLVKIKDTSFSTMSLAGTQLHALTIQWGAKEKAEQEIVTSFIKKRLKPLVSKLEVSKAFTKRAGHLAHICTEINGNLSGKNTVKDLIFSLHPTPAVAGVPRPISIEFIKKNEGYNRSFYTGFIGEINRNSETELYVNLRCMQLNNGMAKLFVGGGITKDSVPEREWRETVEKTAVLGKFISY